MTGYNSKRSAAQDKLAKLDDDDDTVALRDGAKLYAKYDELYKLKEQP